MNQGHHPHSLYSLARLAILLGTLTLLTACSMGQMVVRGSQTILDSGIESMNRETDLQLARDAMPANLKLLEGMLLEDPNNTVLRLYAAEGFYGYSFGFVEIEDPARAKLLYRRCYAHAQQALKLAGIDIDWAALRRHVAAKRAQLHQEIARLQQLDAQLQAIDEEIDDCLRGA